jgi:hypothetical protein
VRRISPGAKPVLSDWMTLSFRDWRSLQANLTPLETKKFIWEKQYGMDNAATRRSGPELRDQFIRERRALIFALEQKRECPIKIVACRCLSGCFQIHVQSSRQFSLHANWIASRFIYSILCPNCDPRRVWRVKVNSEQMEELKRHREVAVPAGGDLIDFITAESRRKSL